LPVAGSAHDSLHFTTLFFNPLKPEVVNSFKIPLSNYDQYDVISQKIAVLIH